MEKLSDCVVSIVEFATNAGRAEPEGRFQLCTSSKQKQSCGGHVPEALNCLKQPVLPGRWSVFCISAALHRCITIPWLGIRKGSVATVLNHSAALPHPSPNSCYLYFALPGSALVGRWVLRTNCQR